MNKNIIILSVISLFVGVLSLYIYAYQEPLRSPVDKKSNIIAALDKNISGLNSFDAELALFANDDITVQEMDAALNEAGEINGAATGLTNDEKNLSSFEGDLGTSQNDEAVNNEIDQSLREMAL